jgi:hypothetical protein
VDCNGEMDILDLSLLGVGMPGLTSACGTTLAESAAVCLEDQQHQVGATVTLSGIQHTRLSLVWAPANDQMRRCYHDLQVATEFGACGIAILIVQHITGMVVIERSRKGTGFDYWLGDRDDDKLMEGKVRLEVSGILDGDVNSVSRRTSLKKRQIGKTDEIAPGYVGIVEFSTPIVCVESK